VAARQRVATEFAFARDGRLGAGLPASQERAAWPSDRSGERLGRVAQLARDADVLANLAELGGRWSG
jgi:hypothetical protein